jgi:DNA-directed RNA polymerase specialized sigma54-like protein
MCAIIANAKSLTEYAEYVCDYYDSTGYISDTFAEIADNNTSVYYSDIIRYISEHVEEVNDAINEFGWDGCGADLYKAGQAAEYMQIENEMHQHAAEIIEAYAANHIRRNYAEEIPAETWERIADELETLDAGDRWDVIRDAVDEIMTETAEEANEMTA